MPPVVAACPPRCRASTQVARHVTREALGPHQPAADAVLKRQGVRTRRDAVGRERSVRVNAMDLFERDNKDDWSAADAGAALLAYSITIAEGGVSDVTVRDYRAAHGRLMRDPVANRTATPLLARLGTPELMWGHLRSVATGSGSWQLRRNAAHQL